MSPQAFAVGGITGDVDGNGVVDSDDIDVLGTMIGSVVDLAGDLNGDGIVDLGDFDLWFEFYSADSGVPLATALLDVNFDQANTLADYSVISSNFSQLTTSFTRGNLNGDGIVNQADVDLYLSRGGIIPEPASAMLGTLALLLGLLLHRRQRPHLTAL